MGKTKKGAPPKRRVYLQLSRRGAYGSLLLIVLACAWMFFVGVLVGRGTSPIQFDMEALSREIAALKASSEERRRQQLDSYAAALEDQSTLDVYEELKRADDGLTIDPSLNRQIPEPSVGTEQPAAGTAEPGAPPVIRRRQGLRGKGPGRSGLDVRPSARAGTSPPTKAGRETRTPVEPRGRMTLQVAAVKDVDVARKMVAELRAQGFDAYRSTATTGGQATWHRVRVGRFTDRQAAAATMRRLEGRGLAPIVVTD
ncbi:MAG: SPOR domain-containing protein [Desulfobacterales bacterium]|nr:SPOR domain-containing protein [Desulfobacterales bacterium]